MKKFLLFALCSLLSSLPSGVAFAYVPSPNFVSLAERLSGQLDRLVLQLEGKERIDFMNSIGQRLINLQNNLIDKTDKKSLDRNYLLEYLRRNITWIWSFGKTDIVYDDLASIIWTHAPRGFDILYAPYETSSVQNRDPEKKYFSLINGGYFNRVDGSLYQAGLLALKWERYTPPVFDDPQITHFACIDLAWRITFITNKAYREEFIQTCSTLFQAGPVVYSKRGETIEENYMSGAYLGREHKRTIMVAFEKGEQQDVWFLTINEEVTFTEVKNIVLRENRFVGTYDNLSIFNLDGGSSIAHVNRLYPELNIGRTKILPIVLGIK